MRAREQSTLDDKIIKPLAMLVKYVAADSSIIATLPLIGSTILRKLLDDCHHSARQLPDKYTSTLKAELGGLAGQPVVSVLLQEICAHVKTMPAQTQGAVTRGSVLNDDPSILDCNAVLAFLRYLCDNVQFAFEPDMRQRLFERIDNEGWSLAEGNEVSADEDDGGYDKHEFLHSGIHSPNLMKVRERGVYAKDAKAKDEKSSQEGGCDKQFNPSPKLTGSSPFTD